MDAVLQNLSKPPKAARQRNCETNITSSAASEKDIYTFLKDQTSVNRPPE